MKRRAFSLLEMMIVMSIIAIIAAVTAPMINKKLIQNASSDSPCSQFEMIDRINDLEKRLAKLEKKAKKVKEQVEETAEAVEE